MLPGPTAQQPVPPAWRQPPDSCLEVASPFVREGGRGVWYLPADGAAASPARVAPTAGPGWLYRAPRVRGVGVVVG